MAERTWSQQGREGRARVRRRGDEPAELGGPLLALQQSAGNAAVRRLVQAKLVVGEAHDPLEQEADQVADQVASGQGAGDVQRDVAELQRDGRDGGDGGAFVAPAAAEERIEARRGGGSALPTETQAKMEAGFGVDFSPVRVHADGEAKELAQGLGAKAFTQGTDIYVGEGVDPSSSEGQRTLAHELTHVVQQNGVG